MVARSFGDVVSGGQQLPGNNVFHIGVPTITLGAFEVIYKMRGVTDGAYVYWSSNDPAQNIPIGVTDVTIAAVLIDEVL